MKVIVNFRQEPQGLFLDLQNGGKIGIDGLSGDILLDEGEGPDCFRDAAIPAAAVHRFDLSVDYETGAHHLLLNFGEGKTHDLGRVEHLEAAREWIAKAAKLLRICHPKGPRAKYGITRIDQPDKGNYGFYVRIADRGHVHQKYFSDNVSGGKANALKLAKEYRDELLSTMPQSKQELAARKKRKALQSGVTGVTHVAALVGDDKTYHYWQASWIDESGRRRSAKFSIHRYGADQALSMAIQARTKAMEIVARQKNRRSSDSHVTGPDVVRRELSTLSIGPED